MCFEQLWACEERKKLHQGRERERRRGLCVREIDNCGIIELHVGERFESLSV